MLRGPAAALAPALFTGLLLAACSLPGGEPAAPDPGDCAVRVENEVRWGLRVRLSAPDGRPPIPFQREIRYLEREEARTVTVPCTYRSALVTGDVRRVSGLSGRQRTSFRTGVCLVPGDTTVAVLDEYGGWEERWWERCPVPPGADATDGARPDTAWGDAPGPAPAP